MASNGYIQKNFLLRLSKLFRNGRKLKGLTQHEMARQLGISQSSISKIEHGILEPSALEWIKFCQLTGTPPDSILADEG